MTRFRVQQFVKTFVVVVLFVLSVGNETRNGETHIRQSNHTRMFARWRRTSIAAEGVGACVCFFVQVSK